MVSAILQELLRCGYSVTIGNVEAGYEHGTQVHVAPLQKTYEGTSLDEAVLRTVRQVRKQELAAGQRGAEFIGLRSEVPTCCVCCRPADQIPETVAEAMMDQEEEQEGVDVFRHAAGDGTYNQRENRFCCTVCYVHIGCPSAPGRGWKAW
jgi:hypothetical protein